MLKEEHFNIRYDAKVRACLGWKRCMENQTGWGMVFHGSLAKLGMDKFMGKLRRARVGVCFSWGLEQVRFGHLREVRASQGGHIKLY